MSITVGTCHKSLKLVKTLHSDGTKSSYANVATASLKVYTPNTPQELEEIFRSLTQQQAIISGEAGFAEINKSNRRTLENFSFKGDFWLPFDRDYITNHEDELTGIAYIDMLAKIDPQLKNVSYLLKSSASNVIKGSAEQSPHSQKIWCMYKEGTTMQQVKGYAKALFTKAFLSGYGIAVLSKSTRAYPKLYMRTLFDTACFSPERWSYEGVPVCEEPFKHNTYYKAHTGLTPCIDTELLTLTEAELMLYEKVKQQLVKGMQEQVDIKKEWLNNTYPSQDWSSIDRGLLTENNELYYLEEGVEQSVRVNDILEAYIAKDHSRLQGFTSRTYGDPLDPDDGYKATLFHNEDDSLYMHSFSHGTSTWRLMPNVISIADMLVARGFTISYDVKQKRGTELRKALKGAYIALKELAPKFIAFDKHDIASAVEDLKQLGSKPNIKSILIELVNTPHSIDKVSRLEKRSHPLEAYVMLREGGGKVITFDSTEGIEQLTKAGAIMYLDNKVEGVSGEELFDEWSTNQERKEVTGFGLYPQDKKDKLNLWSGFNVVARPDNVTREMIAPFIDYLMVLTDNDKKGVEWLLSWIADLVQNPMRSNDIRTSIVLMSKANGTGKSTFTKMLRSFFHTVNVLEDSRLSRYIGKFNKMAVAAVLVILEEVVDDLGGDHAGTTNLLKNQSSNDMMAVELKGVDAKSVPNRTHTVITSNREFRYIASNDRRFTIFNPNSSRQHDKTYFGALWEWWDNGGRELLFTFAAQREFELTDITERYAGSATLNSSIGRLWNEPAWLFSYLCSATNEMTTMSSSELYELYTVWCEEEGGIREPTTQQKFTKSLKAEYLGEGLSYTNQKFIFQHHELRASFADKALNAPDMDWSKYIELDVEDLTDTGAAQSNININGA